MVRGKEDSGKRKTKGNGKGINVVIITSFCGTSWTIIMLLRMDVIGVVSSFSLWFFMLEWTILFLFGWVFLLRKNTTWIDAPAEERFIVCEKMMSWTAFWWKCRINVWEIYFRCHGDDSFFKNESHEITESCVMITPVTDRWLVI